MAVKQLTMSLSAPIYNHRNTIVFSSDLQNVMNIGNEKKYSSLSRLSKQTYLLLTELPEIVCVFESNYQLQYSPSYTSTIHDLVPWKASITVPLLRMLYKP